MLTGGPRETRKEIKWNPALRSPSQFAPVVALITYRPVSQLDDLAALKTLSSSQLEQVTRAGSSFKSV